MAKITCAISGLKFTTSAFDTLSIPHTSGYYHPIFAASYTQLHQYYTKHCKGLLTPNDSYLLFLAFLHASDKIEWIVPVALSPNNSGTKRLIQNSLAQLIRVLEKTAIIRHPSFKQPSFKVTPEGNHLEQIPNWIQAWDDNIYLFYNEKATEKEQHDLILIENRLSRLILSGEKPERYSHVIASWASQAAIFPPHKDEYWQRTIRSCFNIDKMFNTPLKDLKEIKDFIECNIEAGSIHFHTLCHVLNEGISRHMDYLGGSSLALGYELLPARTPAQKAKEEIGENKIKEITEKAPEKEPVVTDYPDFVTYLQAKLAYRVAKFK